MQPAVKRLSSLNKPTVRAECFASVDLKQHTFKESDSNRFEFEKATHRIAFSFCLLDLYRLEAFAVSAFHLCAGSVWQTLPAAWLRDLTGWKN